MGPLRGWRYCGRGKTSNSNQAAPTGRHNAFAAYIDVSESVKNPSLYYHNNISGSVSLLKTIIDVGVVPVVFSSPKHIDVTPEGSSAAWAIFGHCCFCLIAISPPSVLSTSAMAALCLD